jgi:hypothetical protein
MGSEPRDFERIVERARAFLEIAQTRRANGVLEVLLA